MKAITTKYHGPTEFKGARISASAEGVKRLYVSRHKYDYTDDMDRIHLSAAVELCERYDWQTRLIGGATKDGYVFVFENSTPRNVA
jgi:hypothetical protein